MDPRDNDALCTETQIFSVPQIAAAGDLPGRVRARREQMGVSCRALAKQMRIAHSTIVRIENGVSGTPRIDILVTLANHLHVSVEWLVQGR